MTIQRLTLAVLLTATLCLGAPLDDRWDLVWSDEFDGDTIDTNRWRVEDAALVKNNEQQYYAPDEAYIQNGHLVLRSQEREMGRRPYTSGLVETRGRFSQAFGRFEIRAKLPGGQGLWPAIWMLPEDRSWPPEIDIMELLGHEPRTIHMTHHWGQWPNVESNGNVYKGPDFTKDFHVFAVEWTPDRIDWFVDGEKRHSSTQNIPQKPFYLILNTAVGGNWPGDPDATTVFPQFHTIDYVRVYVDKKSRLPQLWLNAKHGNIVPTPKAYAFSPREKVTLEAVPDIGFKFSHWSGDLEGAENPVTVPMLTSRRIEAHFMVDPNAPTCLSLGKEVIASSRENYKLSWENAVDGDMNTRWSSAFKDMQWIKIDLGTSTDIKAVRLRWEDAAARVYELQLSDNGTSWRTIHKQTQGRGDVETITGLDARGRYLRLLAQQRATEYGISLWEFEVYGSRKTSALDFKPIDIEPANLDTEESSIESE